MSAPVASPKGYKLIIGIGIAVWIAAAAHEYATRNGVEPQLPNIQVGSAVTNNQLVYKVLRVVDGDTLEIDLDGTKEKVRLIGINTPETVDPRKPVQCFGEEASKRMKDLAQGKMVHLEYDDSQSMRDIYGRLLAYVYLEDGQMLNRKMIAEGYAYEYTYMTPYKYQQEFRDLVTLAKENKRGLWADNTCAGKK